VVSSTPWPHFTPGKDPVPIVRETGWAPRPVWTGGKSRPHRDSFPDRPARSQSLYRLSYWAHNRYIYNIKKTKNAVIINGQTVGIGSGCYRLIKLEFNMPLGQLPVNKAFRSHSAGYRSIYCVSKNFAIYTINSRLSVE